MLLKAESLAGHLGRGRLARLYCVSGDEPLLIEEALDAVRAAGRAAGFTEREVLHASGKFDWSRLTAAASSLSLFAERRMVEIRLPGGKPGREGGEALRAHAEAASDDLLTVLALPRLDRATRTSAWASALETHGVWIDVRRIERAQLPAWLRSRLAAQRHSAPPEALEFLADQTEGNLLAARQEIAKLGLLYPAGELSLAQVTDAVRDVARFEIGDLPSAMLAGDAARTTRTLTRLRAEGEALPLLLWWVAEEIRGLVRAQRALAAGRPLGSLARDMRMWPGRERLLEGAAARVPAARATALLARCADVDRLAKGLAAPRRDSDPWLELAEIALEVASGQGPGGAPGRADRAHP